MNRFCEYSKILQFDTYQIAFLMRNQGHKWPIYDKIYTNLKFIVFFQEDEKFLTELFNQLTDEDTDENRRKELVLFLKEFFSFSTTLQPQARESFFKTLNSLGVLQAMEVTLASENKVKRLLFRIHEL